LLVDSFKLTVRIGTVHGICCGVRTERLVIVYE
jgi:hypothetical protein